MDDWQKREIESRRDATKGDIESLRREFSDINGLIRAYGVDRYKIENIQENADFGARLAGAAATWARTATAWAVAAVVLSAINLIGLAAIIYRIW